MKDLKAGTYVLATIGAGVAVFIFSLFPFNGIDLGVISVNQNGWKGFALLGTLLLIAAAAIAAIRTFAANVQLPQLPVSWNFVTFAAAALGTLCVLLRFVTKPDPTSLKIGAFLMLIAALVETGAAFMSLRMTGEKMPWEQPTAPPVA